MWDKGTEWDPDRGHDSDGKNIAHVEAAEIGERHSDALRYKSLHDSLSSHFITQTDTLHSHLLACAE